MFELLASVCIIIIIILIKRDYDLVFVSREEFCDYVRRSCANYFKSFTVNDLTYRHANNARDYMDQYLACFRPMTNDEKMRIYMLIWIIWQKLPRTLSRFAWRVALLRDDQYAERGAPHTIGGVIVLREVNLRSGRDDLMGTLLHEYAHIIQKQAPNLTNELLQSMGFYRISHRQLGYDPARLDFMFACNPDVPCDSNVEYYYKSGNDRFMLKSVYVPGDTPTGFLIETRDIAIDTTMKKITSIDFNSDLYQQGHPYEIMAEVVSRYYLRNGFVRPDWYQCMKEWK